jgi:hypothetical protein
VRRDRFIWIVLSASALAVACGKNGPPLPPLVKLPLAPVDLTADRRGTAVDVQFTVPGVNTDNSRPANVSRVDVYAITAPATPVPLTDAQILKLGTKVASISVKAPRDPNDTVDEDESDADVDQPTGVGLDQNSLAHASETLTSQALAPVTLPKDPNAPKPRRPDDTPRPLLAPVVVVPLRTYVAAGVSTRGKPGPFSKRVTVPLVPPPPPPESPVVAYDEKAVTITWKPVAVSGGVQRAPTGGELPSEPVGVTLPTIAYHVYDVSGTAGAGKTLAAAGGGTSETSTPTPPATVPAGPLRLTQAPVSETQFADARMVWGDERCYTVRVVETLNGQTIESEAPPAVCRTLVDTFPPAAPANLKSAPGEGAISLIWDPNTEKDLAGYIVMRGLAPGTALEQMTPAPIHETTLRDDVAAGIQYVYAVKAVDKAGNVSPLSNRVQESAR